MEKQHPARLKHSQLLRQRAKELLRRSPDVSRMAAKDIQALVHELQVHQIELELQNEELRQAQLELAESRDRYSDLYEFAPVGYVTLDERGQIIESNLRAADLLGVERKALTGSALFRFVARDSQDNCYLHLRAVFAGGAKQTCELDLQRKDGAAGTVRLESLVQQSVTAAARKCRTAIIDITDVRATRQELQQLNEELEQRVKLRTADLRQRTNQLALQSAQLQRSESEFRTLAGNVPALFSYVDRDRRYRYVNRRYEVFWQRPASAIIGKTKAEVVGPKIYEAMRPYIDRALQGEETTYEAEFDPPAGRRIMQVHNVPDRDEMGKVRGFFALLVDITALRQAEQALAASEAQLKAEAAALAQLNDSSSRLWHMQNLREGLDEMLVATMRLLGADMGTIQILDAGTGVLTMAAHRGFESDFLEFFREVTSGSDSACGSALRLRQRILVEDIDADPMFASLRATARAAGFRAIQSTPLIARDGIPLGILSTHWRSAHRPSDHDLRRMDLYVRQATDFMEDCRTNEILRQRENRMRAILNTATDAIITIDRHGIIAEANPVTGHMFGYTAAELAGQSITVLIPAAYRDKHGNYTIGEVVGLRKNGSTFSVDLAVSEVRDLDLFTAIIRDISARKQAERSWNNTGRTCAQCRQS